MSYHLVLENNSTNIKTPSNIIIASENNHQTKTNMTMIEVEIIVVDNFPAINHRMLPNAINIIFISLNAKL